MTHALTLVEWRAALRQSFALLRQRPLPWLLVTSAFLIVVEALTLVPYIGFIAKLGVAALFGAQFYRLCADVDAGGTPRFRRFVESLALPFAAQATLVVAGLVPFAAGIGHLAIAGGWPGIAFFFGTMGSAEPPALPDYLVLKAVMAIVGGVLILVPATVVLAGLSGIAALRVAVVAALRNWPSIVFVVLVTAMFEGTLALLPLVGGPPLVIVVVAVAALIAFVAWLNALSYAWAIRMLDLPRAVLPPQAPARAPDRPTSP